MAFMKFDVYQLNADKTAATLNETIEFDTEVEDLADQHRITKRVADLTKEVGVLVSPNSEEAAWVLMKPKRRGRTVDLSGDVVKYGHELYVIHGESVNKIRLEIFTKFGQEVSVETIKKFLKQERDLEHTGFDSLREQAAEMMKEAGNSRNKYSEQRKAGWVKKLENGMSGSAIAKEEGINSSVVNGHFKKMGIKRDEFKNVEPVEVAEEVTEEVVG